jgi:hypothetical protein
VSAVRVCWAVKEGVEALAGVVVSDTDTGSPRKLSTAMGRCQRSVCAPAQCNPLRTVGITAYDMFPALRGQPAQPKLPAGSTRSDRAQATTSSAASLVRIWYQPRYGSYSHTP